MNFIVATIRAVPAFLIQLYGDCKAIKWYHWSILLIFVLRALWVLPVLDVVSSEFAKSNPQYTHGVRYYFACTRIMELNACYIIHKLYGKYISVLACIAGVGSIVDQVGVSATRWTTDTAVWLLVAFVYTFIIWKENKKNEQRSTV